ncbi:MAG: hypothetical protein ACOYJS_07015 [Acutalibacteraceae bacterium]|jgi:stage III sporulation protein AA
MKDRFENVLYCVGPNLRGILSKVPITVRQNTDEIRIRKDRPLSLTVAGETVFLRKDGQTVFCIENDLAMVSKQDIDECYRLLCNNSAFAHEEELKEGYVKLRDGSRAGVFGTLSAEGSMRDISSINIRIAREIFGISGKLVSAFHGEGWLIAGPPGSGKTTILRDFVRLISGNSGGKIYRVAVIDSRGEISGGGKNDLGPACDVLNISDKARGLEIAVRTMYPEILAFDEIGTTEELMRVMESFNSGVSVITTAHIGRYSELMKRKVTRELLMSGVIERVALLPRLHGGEIKIYKTEEILSAAV